MSLEEQFYPNWIAILPNEIIYRHNQIIQKYGLENVVNSAIFKKAREMYQTARYAMGMTARTWIKYWICPASEKYQTPDTFLIKIPDRDNNEIKIECVEVTLWENHVDNMLEIIRKKIKKYYPFYFVILIHIEKPNSYIDSRYFSDIFNALKTEKISFGAIRFWMPIENKLYKDTLMWELYPSDNYTEFSTQSIMDIYSEINQKNIKIDIDNGKKRIMFSDKDFNIELPLL